MAAGKSIIPPRITQPDDPESRLASCILAGVVEVGRGFLLCRFLAAIFWTFYRISGFLGTISLKP
jgi:hypothetical protein